jgi:hypothetical protein
MKLFTAAAKAVVLALVCRVIAIWLLPLAAFPSQYASADPTLQLLVAYPASMVVWVANVVERICAGAALVLLLWGGGMLAVDHLFDTRSTRRRR